MTQFTFPNIMAAVILQPETFAGGSSREQILAFIAGLELKMNKEDRFSVNLGNLLTNHHKIQADKRDWIGQLEDFSRKKGFEWISGLKQLGIELVLNEMNAHQREQYATYLKHFIVKLIGQLSPGSMNFNSAWIDQWLGIVLLHTAWGRNMWNAKQLDLIEQIDEEIKKVNVLCYETPSISVDLDILRYQFMEQSAVPKPVEK
ncbi:MAG: hypothetical protein HRT58_14980 [Crocinitomicaceae bacterium]|nr:hypothetical protein [Flavobacteriales bacterium]NQZ36971.1 hypothetical protein [Crocinitomicaceae bacterium]